MHDSSAILNLIAQHKAARGTQLQMLPQVRPAVSTPAAATTTPPSTPPEDTSPTTMEPGLLAPSTLAPASDCAPSPATSNNWATYAKRAKAHDGKFNFNQGIPIFRRTRQTMRCKQMKLFINASRGYEREGYVPTRQTIPPLLKRRYSIDVNTEDWANPHVKECWAHGEDPKVKVPDKPHQETEPVIQHEPFIPLPNYNRYQELGYGAARDPPMDTDVYLELGNATIHNDAYWYMTETQNKPGYKEAWMRDESLDMAIEVLRQDMHCEESAIGIANANTAQVFFGAARDGDAAHASNDDYRRQFRDKKWVFIVMNDAIGSNSDGGVHWSLIALDFVHKRVHYYDSLFLEFREQQDLATYIGMGLLQMLGIDVPTWSFNVEYHSPNQNKHNRFPDDAGACGPYVYKMIEMMVTLIQHKTGELDEEGCTLSLNHEFPARFRAEFDSLQVRFYMQQTLFPYRARAEATRLMYEHDQRAVEGEDVILSSFPPAVYNPPPPHQLRAIQYMNEHHGGIQLPSSPTWGFGPIDTSDNETLSDPPSEPADDIFLPEEERNYRRRRSSSTRAQRTTPEHSEEEDAGPVVRNRRRHSSPDSDEWLHDMEEY